MKYIPILEYIYEILFFDYQRTALVHITLDIMRRVLSDKTFLNEMALHNLIEDYFIDITINKYF